MADERKCKWCGVDISHRRWSAKTCGLICKEAIRYQVRFPDSKPFSEARMCIACGSEFTAMTSTRRHCDIKCRKADYLEKDRPKNTSRAREYRSSNPQKYRDLDKARRNLDPEKFRNQARKRYQDIKENFPEKHLGHIEDQRKRERLRNAERALSMILLPVAEPPKGKHHDV